MGWYADGLSFARRDELEFLANRRQLGIRLEDNSRGAIAVVPTQTGYTDVMCVRTILYYAD